MNCDKLKIYTANPKVTAKITKSNKAKKATKKTKQNYKRYSTHKKAGERQKMQQTEKEKKNSKKFKLKPKHSNCYIKYMWPEHPHYKARIVITDKKTRPNRCCLPKNPF